MPKNSIPENTFTKTKTGYRFIGKDPIIELAVARWRMSGLSVRRIAALSHVAPSTIHNLDTGKTRQPRHLTMAWMLDALGVKVLYRTHDNDGTPREYRVKVLDRPPTPLFKK